MLILAIATTDDFLFDSALKVVDEALVSAAKAGKKTSETADLAFKRAIEELERYEMNYRRKHMLNERMAAAKAEDINSLTITSRLQAIDIKQPAPTKVVEFILVNSLPDLNPTIVKREHQIYIHY